MGHFYRVLNVLVGSGAGRVDAVGAVRRAAASLALIAAGEDETADRTLLVAMPPDGPWAVVYDDAFEADERAAPELGLAIDRAAARAVVGATVCDGALTELFLCVGGSVVDAFSVGPVGASGEGRGEPERWRPALIGCGADVETMRRAWLASGPPEARLAAVARVLRLMPAVWLEATGTGLPD